MIKDYSNFLNEKYGASDVLKPLVEDIFNYIKNNTEIKFYKELPIIDSIINFEYKNVNYSYGRFDPSKSFMDDERRLNNIIFTFIFKNDEEDIKSTIMHELTHCLHYYNEVINNKHTKSYELQNKLNRNKWMNDIPMISYFRDLFYLSLDHELNARVASAYYTLLISRENNIKELKELLKKTNQYEIIEKINSFDPIKYSQDLMKNIGLDNALKIFNNLDIEIIKKLESEEDLKNYLLRIKKIFNNKVRKYKYKLNKVLLDVIENVKNSKKLNEKINNSSIYCCEDMFQITKKEDKQ